MVEFLIAAGIGISLFVLIYLLRRKGIKLPSSRVALAIQLLWISRFTFFYLKPEAEPVYNAYFVVYDQALFLLDGVLVWLYVRTLLRPDKSFSGIWPHFIPFAVLFLYSTYLATFQPEEVIRQFNEGIELLKVNQSSLATSGLILVTFLVGFNLFYLLQSVRITKAYNSRLKEHLSNVDHLTITWVKTFQNLWIILFIIPLIIYFFNDWYRFTEHVSLGYVLAFTFVLLSMVFNFFLLEQVYKPVSLFKKEPSKVSQNTAKNQSQFEKLKDLLEEKQYFLDEALSLSQLAGYLDLKPA